MDPRCLDRHVRASDRRGNGLTDVPRPRFRCPMTHRLSKEQWRAALDSDDEAAVISALHQACPCSGSPALYEAFMALLGEYKHDPRPAVRAVSVPLQLAALDLLVQDDEHANGYDRNRPA